ncbi:MAG TPA: hypothetical protein VKR21_06465 [Solirubrobacteraceae bacterium]|nr:hypothetical protein [Solirubrobacteraceae bacterium]
MKKLGTPSGAGPGSANEKVGFDGPGTPGPVGPVGAWWVFALCFGFEFVAFFSLLVGAEPFCLTSLREELLGFLKLDVGLTVCDFLVVLVCVAVVFGFGVDVVAAGVDVVLAGVVTVTVLVGVVAVVVVVWQFAVTFWTGGVPGGSI